MTFGSKLKTLRTKEGLTQLQLSVKLGTSKSNISKYEADIIEPNMKTLVMIARFFHVSSDYLLGLSNNITELINIKSDSSPLKDEEIEIISYYNKLSLIDKRWIVGQMIDLHKKAEINALDTTFNQKTAQ